VRLTDCMFFPIKKIIQIMGILLKKNLNYVVYLFFSYIGKSTEPTYVCPWAIPKSNRRFTITPEITTGYSYLIKD
jgi:hypothetical protein